MFKHLTRLCAIAAALVLGACGGGVTTDGENFYFTAWVTVPPVYVVSGPVTYVPAAGSFPSQCVVQESSRSYTLYGYGYYGCPQLAGRDLVRAFETAYPSVWVDSLTYPTYGTAYIIIS